MRAPVQSVGLAAFTGVAERRGEPSAWDPSIPLETEFAVHVNALSVDSLFALYERTRFLYPAKAARLTPHLDVVRENWRRLLQAGDSLLYVLTAGTDEDGLASVAVWRTTHDSWVWQHLVCEGNPLGSRSVMLGGLVRCVRQSIGESQQNWFRPENRFPARVFGTMVESLGDSLSSVERHLYFAVPRLDGRLHALAACAAHQSRGVHVVPYDASHHEALCALAALARGRVYVTAEALDCDVDLETVGSLYRSVGLRRTRQVWLAYRAGADRPVGAALAYRGPLGLNFSFLESRCDLLLQPGLSEAEAAAVSESLMAAVLPAYADFELDDIPVVADEAAAPSLYALGGQFLRNYCQGIWLKDGQPQLYRHVDRFYTRLMNRVERRPSTGPGRPERRVEGRTVHTLAS
jgi:hypothetical protein